jgi:hypothetical protein
MQQAWAALKGGWSPKSLHLHEVQHGDIACAAVCEAVAAVGQPPALEQAASGAGGTPCSPAALAIWQQCDTAGGGKPPDAEYARALRPFLTGTRNLSVDAPPAFLAALLKPAGAAADAGGSGSGVLLALAHSFVCRGRDMIARTRTIRRDRS